MKVSFPEIEKKILKYWQKNNTFKKSIERRRRRPSFIFYEGPPTANARPGIHHVLARVFKDIICRYKTMQGFKVVRKAGWDTHGLPVELEIEKKLGLKNKKDIEKYGIARFNKKCKESVWQYKKDWEDLTARIAYWLDLENPYITFEPDYIESLWWIIKQIWKKGLLYQDYKVVPYCPRCGTSLSSHEVALGYKNISEKSVYLKFKVEPGQKIGKVISDDKTYLLSWTTTPWTLPGNVALAVHPELGYRIVSINKNTYIVGDKIAEKVLGLAFSKKETQKIGKKGRVIKGKSLTGLKYKPLFDIAELQTKTSYRVYPAKFVSEKEGTGIVHTAVMYGADDFELGKKYGLPKVHTVDKEGRFNSKVKGFEGKYVKDKKTEAALLNYLQKNSSLFAQEMFKHDYPFCWRCNSHLLYYAKESWFIRMTALKKDLIKNNQKINWVPAYLKEGRFGEWLREIKDWAFSRERYWGTPLPVWQCKNCSHQEVIGSKNDLLKQKFTDNKYFILRHGESLRQKKKIAVCWPEKIHCPLTKKGERQVKLVAKKLKKENIDLIFSSDLLRTKQTTQILGKELGAKPKFDKRLREVDVGVLNERPVKEVGKFWDPEGKLSPSEYYLKRFQVAPQKGENYSQIEKRIHEFIKEIDKKYQGKNILIISHQRPLTLLEKVMTDYDFKKFVKIIVERKELKVGEIKELKFKTLPYNRKKELDFHRPYIDEVKFYCPKCKSLMERVPEVIDCWFDSGAMPFAQYHYPFENKKLIDEKEQFPADYISEAIDQTRGWFYTLLAISTLLGFGTPYKNVISLGHVLDEKGEKMSKSKGNVVDPREVVEKYGSDAVRWYFFTVNQPGDSKLFSERDIEGVLKRFIMTFWNSFLFFETYTDKKAKISEKPSFENILDKWILSKLNELISEVTQGFEKYDLINSARIIERFVIEDLSQWYIRRSRRRFQKPKTKKEKMEAQKTLGFVLLTLSKLTAPFAPFVSEKIYQDITNSESVHLEDWPKVNKKRISKSLNKKMEQVREIIALGLKERALLRIKVRQPLPKLKVKSQKLKVKERDLLELIKEELNVKEIIFDPKIKNEIELDTKITPELKEEGIVREVIRQIQEMRKTLGLKPRHKITVQYFGTPNLNKILTKNKDFILTETKAKNFRLKEKLKGVFDIEKEVRVDKKNLWLTIKKIK